MTTPTDHQLDQATRNLIQTLLLIQYHQDLTHIRDTPYRRRTSRHEQQIKLRWKYQDLGLENLTIPLELQP